MRKTTESKNEFIWKTRVLEARSFAATSRLKIPGHLDSSTSNSNTLKTGGALTVYMNVSVLAFPFIETIALKFTADFYLNLKWYDLRIDYRDLNTIHSLNTLGRADQDAIWTPKLGFTNALGPFQVIGYTDIDFRLCTVP